MSPDDYKKSLWEELKGVLMFLVVFVGGPALAGLITGLVIYLIRLIF